jgi:CheY-like chemotaxis protein
MTILVAEDDLTTRLLYLRALAGLEDVHIVAVSSVAEAIEVASAVSVELVILDLHFPDGNGSEVLQVFEQHEVYPQVLVASSFIDELDPHGWHPGYIDLVPKPIDAQTLRSKVVEKLATPARQQPFSPAEYVQLACLGGHSLVLEVVGDEGKGHITIDRGVVWAAYWEDLTGMTAFQQAVSSHHARVKVRGPYPQLGPRQLAGGWQELLIEAARQEDEAGLGLQTLRPNELDFSDLFKPDSIHPPPPVSGPQATPATKTPVEELVSLGVRAVIARRYDEAIQLFEQVLEIAPKSTAVRHRLHRLKQLRLHKNEQV